MRLLGGDCSPLPLALTLFTFAGTIIGPSLAIPLGVLAELPDPPCSATSDRTGTFVDLRSIIRKENDHDYNNIRGYDYNSNFTLNICAPVHSSENLKFYGLPESYNVSAYYHKGDKTYSLGQASSTPKFRGRKLVLEYTGGSLCPKLDADGLPIEGKDNEDGYRKSSLLSFTCDRELVGATVSFDMLRICLFSVFNLVRRMFGRSPTSRFGGYTAASGDGRFGRGTNTGRPDEWSDVDDENRLIDQLDDEWSDG
ncbi:hypothetical protein ABW19_dt0203953 [Dactylella cylindrospora]|nr:hypothetical protein ABW19_dt0203953 [Dactylella cylindrospora]